MEKKLALLVVLSGALVIVGCGKDKTAKKTKTVKVASLQNSGDIPLLLTDSQAFLEDDADNQFAFVDTEESLFEDEAVAVAVSMENGSDDITKKGFTIDLEKEDKADQTLAVKLELDEEAFDRVQFDFDSNAIKKDQKSALKKDISLAKKAVAEGREVVVAGHCCPIGSAAYNISLSQKRAEAVKKEMIKEGLPAEKVKTIGLGFESPLVWSDSTDRLEKIKDLAPNRRAELNVS